MCYCYKTTDMKQELSKKTRTESDLIGSREVPESALYGVQTLRGIENFRISKFHLNEYPLFIQALAITKMGAAIANRELDLLTKEQTDAILKHVSSLLHPIRDNRHTQPMHILDCLSVPMQLWPDAHFLFESANEGFQE